MAKWGEGDPRWLVEERPDAINVNNWHWTDKNASQWSKDKLTELFVGKKIKTDFGLCEITEMVKCEGDAVVNNRKAKLIFFYEWVLEMKWKGTLLNGESEVNGTIEVPNLSEEHEVADVDVNILVDTTGSEADVLKEMMRSTGVEVIRECLTVYLTTLKEEFSKGLILPTKDGISSSVAKVGKGTHNNPTSGSKPTAAACKFEVCELKTSETFKCQADEFFRALTCKDLVRAFTRGDCILESEKGGKFELFDGNVHGKFIDLVPNKMIKQKWRFKTWPSEHYSEVTIEITQKSDCTEVNVLQTGIPKTELENTREGWKRFYWESMKRTFGFGAILF